VVSGKVAKQHDFAKQLACVRRSSDSETVKADISEAERLKQDRVMLHEFAEHDQVVLRRSDGSRAVFGVRSVMLLPNCVPLFASCTSSCLSY
jgi:hypothetical protein